MIPTELPLEEFKLLENSGGRTGIPGAEPIVVTAKLLGPPHRLDNATLANVEFVDCDFLGHFMFNVNLTNVTFTRCAIAGVRWEDGAWTNVKFLDCAAQGKSNNIVPGKGAGRNEFVNCRFIGGPVKPGEDPDDIENYGHVGSAGTSSFEGCNFERMAIWILGKANFQRCNFVGVSMRSPRSEVPIEEVLIQDSRSTFTADLSNKDINSLSLLRSTFEDFELIHSKLNVVRMENVTGCFDFSAINARSMTASDCIFKGPRDAQSRGIPKSGLRTTLSKLDYLALTHCKFDGADVSWDARGEPKVFDGRGNVVPRFTGDKQPLRYLTDWGVVKIKDTALAGIKWDYSEIKSLTIEDSSFTDNSLAHCEIGGLAMNGVTIGGRLDFSDTRVGQFRSDRLTKRDLTLVKDKLTQLELTAADADRSPSRGGKWLT